LPCIAAHAPKGKPPKRKAAVSRGLQCENG
jgi:hypothetical protein